ncbi:MAG TPA: hypothetical protein VFI54_26450 [Solirubrobacteraceae bacterium]|nr:hypothetical protein [Solirubrobacteraceae bacterium]
MGPTRRSSISDDLGRWSVAVVIALIAAPLTAGSSASARTLKPRLGRTAIVAAVSGNVRIRPRHARSFVRLNGRRLIGFGATVDANHGTVRLVTARDASGGRQSGMFNGGAFVVTQERSGLVDLLLAGGRQAGRTCRTATSGVRTGGGGDLKAAAAVSPTVLRLLHARAHGRFRTRGKYAAATVRGTQWTTMDRCDGTQVADQAGRVMSQTRDAPLQFELAPGQSVGYRCSRGGAPPVSTGYCLAVLAQDTTVVVGGHKTRVVLYAAALITMSPDDQTDLCVTGPTGNTTCTPYPLAPVEQFGFREAIVGCVPNEGAGDYEIGWRVRGVALGAPLTYHAPVPAASLSPCRAWLGKPRIGGSMTGLASDLKAVNRYSLPTAAAGAELRAYLAPNGVPGDQRLRGVVYADAGGAPGALLGVTGEIDFPSSAPAGWYDLPFATPLELSSGDYWLGLISGPQPDVAAFAYDPVPDSRAGNANAYAAGPTDPFGPIVTDNAQMSLYLVYDVAGP